MIRTRPSSSGFTLLELILVMLIISITLAIAAPSLSGWGRGGKMRDATDELLAAVRYARTQSVAEGRVYRLNLDPSGQGYWLTMQEGQNFIPLGNTFGIKWSLPESFRLQATGVDQGAQRTSTIDFFPTGRTQPARIRLISPNGDTAEIVCPTPAEQFALATDQEAGR